MSKKKKLLLAGVLLSTSLFLVACGSSDENVDAEAPDIEGSVDKGEHIDEFDVEFEDIDDFEVADEDFTDLPMPNPEDDDSEFDSED